MLKWIRALEYVITKLRSLPTVAGARCTTSRLHTSEPNMQRSVPTGTTAQVLARHFTIWYDNKSYEEIKCSRFCK